VLAGVREGLSNADIAHQRGSSVETVRFHLRNVREKLGLHGRQALTDWPGRPVEVLRAGDQRERAWRIREQIPLVAVKDMERMLAFYAGALGFDVVARYPDPPEMPGWAALGSGAARLMLHLGHHTRDTRGARPDGTITLCLYLDGIASLRDELVANGHAASPIEQMPYGAFECFLQDPEGNELSLVEFPASDPLYTTRTTPSEGHHHD
jgi:catechol 2,3-dioxygenase-like lactoylglutathione lyase family enzyme